MLDLTFGPSFKVKRWFTGFGELSFQWTQICIGSPMRRSSSPWLWSDAVKVHVRLDTGHHPMADIYIFVSHMRSALTRKNISFKKNFELVVDVCSHQHIAIVRIR